MTPGTTDVVSSVHHLKYVFHNKPTPIKVELMKYFRSRRTASKYLDILGGRNTERGDLIKQKVLRFIEVGLGQDRLFESKSPNKVARQRLCPADF